MARIQKKITDDETQRKLNPKHIQRFQEQPVAVEHWRQKNGSRVKRHKERFCESKSNKCHNGSLQHYNIAAVNKFMGEIAGTNTHNYSKFLS